MSARLGAVQRRPLVTVILCCLLVLLAGCSGLSALGGDDTTDSPSTGEDATGTGLANVPETHAEYLRSASNLTVPRGT